MLAKKYREQTKHVVSAFIRNRVNYVQPKLDGIRNDWDGIDMWSREGNLIPGLPLMKADLVKGYGGIPLDGELFCRGADFDEIISSVRRTVNIYEDIRVQYWIYDLPVGGCTFAERLPVMTEVYAHGIVRGIDKSRFVLVPTYEVHTEAEVHRYEAQFVHEGYEGLIFRSADGLYEFGKRSKGLLKLKRWYDIEVTVVGFKEGENKYVGMLGAFYCEGEHRGVKFKVKVGTGFDDAQRKAYYLDESLIGKPITIKYQELNKKTSCPRFPVFKCFRDYE